MQFNFYYRATAASHCSGLHFDPLSFTAALQVFGSAALFMHSSLSSGPLQSLRSFLSPLCSGSLSCSWPSLGRALAVGSWRLSDCKGMKPSLLHHRANRWYNVFVLIWRVWFYPHMLHMMNKHLPFVPEVSRGFANLILAAEFLLERCFLFQTSHTCSVVF